MRGGELSFLAGVVVIPGVSVSRCCTAHCSLFAVYSLRYNETLLSLQLAFIRNAND